jgi:hypothetical protein
MHFEDIGERLKGVEGEADREDDLERSQGQVPVEQGSHGLKILDQKVRILEEPEDAQVRSDACYQEQSLPPGVGSVLDSDSSPVVDADQNEQNQQVGRDQKAIKEAARNQEQDQPVSLTPEIPEDPVHHGQEDQEFKRVEEHGGNLAPRAPEL